jgi:8-oxo-dGTP diphosphatase
MRRFGNILTGGRMGTKLRGAVAVIFDKVGRVLLLQRGDGAHWMPLKWAPPGGLIEPNEAPLDAAVRETEEETTLKIYSPVEFRVSPNGEIIYYTTSQYTGDVAIDFEHQDFAWVYPDDLTNYDMVPDLEAIIAAAREKLDNE